MDYIVNPIAAVVRWSFDNILVPIGELAGAMNPNAIFSATIVIGLVYWLVMQSKFDKKAEREGGLK